MSMPPESQATAASHLNYEVETMATLVGWMHRCEERRAAFLRNAFLASPFHRFPGIADLKDAKGALP